MSARDTLKLPARFDKALSPIIKAQLHAIGQRVYDLVAMALGDVRAADSDRLRRDRLIAAHTMALSVFESECLGYFHNVAGGLDLFKSLACKAGCTFCCELRVEVTALEAVAIWGAAAGPDMEPVRDAIIATGKRTQSMSDEARRQARIRCGFLKDGVCAAYQSRPYACRGMFATDARDCEAVMTTPAGLPLPPVRSPAVPRALSGIFFAGVNAALQDAGLQHDTLELNSAVAQLIEHPDTFARWLAGEKAFPSPSVPRAG